MHPSIDSAMHAVGSLDRSVAGWIEAHARPDLIAAMGLVSRWQAAPLRLLASAGIGALLLHRRDRESFWLLALTVVPGTLLNHVFKHTIRQPRPGTIDPSAPTDYGFPSGHVATATLFYGSLAVIVLLRARRWPIKACAVLAAAALVTAVAASRLVLRAHDLSAVLAAAVGGLAWIALSLGVVRGWRRGADRPSA
jgi:undecaprenyl-diphosphatase